MEEFEAHPEAPLSRTNGGEQASADQRFAEIKQAAQHNRMNGNRVNGDAGKPSRRASCVFASRSSGAATPSAWPRPCTVSPRSGRRPGITA